MDMRRSWKISLGVMRHAWEQPPPCFLIQNIKRILTLKPQIFCMPNRGGGALMHVSRYRENLNKILLQNMANNRGCQGCQGVIQHHA